jgi:hypothetical protein
LGLASKIRILSLSAKGTKYVSSAKGAQYDSQGQALSGAKRVAPGYKDQV